MVSNDRFGAQIFVPILALLRRTFITQSSLMFESRDCEEKEEVEHTSVLGLCQRAY